MGSGSSSPRRHARRFHGFVIGIPGPRRGFPWLSNIHQQQVAQANYFVDQTLMACQLAWQYFLEHPEDLGATPDQEVPASIWQFPSVRELQVTTKAITFAVFQCAFEAPTSKPTRFLTNLSAFTQQPPAFATWPRFDAQHRYVGPLPPRCPHGGHDQVLAGRFGRVWATSAAAAYPPLMCEWIAHAVLASAAQGGIRSASHSSGPEVRSSHQDAGGLEAVVSEAVDSLEAVAGSAQDALPRAFSCLEAVGSVEGSAQNALPEAVSSSQAVGSVEAGGSAEGPAQSALPEAVSSSEAVGSVEAGVKGAPPRFAKAEDFAEAISAAKTPTRAEVATLFGLLPHETPPRSTMYSRRTPSSFTTGLFKKGGGLIGLRTACRRFPASTEALTSFVRRHMPGHPFTTVSLYLNTGTEPHKDSRNAHIPNGIIALSDFAGGEVWTECEGGDSFQVIDGKRIAGRLVPITAEPAYIHAYRDLHFTMPWTGRRLVIIAFSVADHEQAPQDVLSTLRGQGFVLPGEASQEAHLSFKAPAEDADAAADSSSGSASEGPEPFRHEDCHNEGPPLSLEWDGKVEPINDGFGLCSPTRWRLGARGFRLGPQALLRLCIGFSGTS